MDVKAMTPMDVAKVPDGVKLRHVPRFNDDPENPEVVGEDTPEARGCYVFEALDGKRKYLNMDESAETWKALAPATEDEDMGAVVGELFKLDPRDGKLRWAGAEGSKFPIRQKQLDRLTTRCTLHVEAMKL